MATQVRAPVSAPVVRWAREEAGLTTEDLARKIGVKPDRINLWESGDGPVTDGPTVRQLQLLADAVGRTAAALLASKPPKKAHIPRPPDFRGPRDGKRSGLEPTVLKEIARAEARRTYFIDLVGKQRLRLPVWRDEAAADAAQKVRHVMGISLEEQASWRDASVALRHWRDAAERMGILVFQMSRVSKELVQGLSVPHKTWPFMILNGADRPEVRSFTWAHELGHLARRSGAVCIEDGPGDVEAACNAFAAELLMPAAHFRDAATQGEPVALIPTLARQYAVSWSAVAVRYRTLGLIDQRTLDEHLRIARQRAMEADERERRRRAEKPPRIPHPVLHLRNLSPTYVQAALEALESNRISYVDATHILSANMSTIDSMRERLASGEGVVD